MSKLRITLLVIIAAALLLPGCGGTADTGFERMLGYVPHSLSVNYDIFYGDMKQAIEINGLEDLDNYTAAEEAIRQMPGEEGMRFVYDYGTASSAFPYWNNESLAPLTGFDAFSFDRVAVIGNIPPKTYMIGAGDIDEELIGRKLAEQGYSQEEYGQHSYYSIRGDFEMDIRHPMGRIVMGSMNRVAVGDGFIITSPSTAEVTGIFDTMDGNNPSFLDNEACRALADSLGEPLAATITRPERIILDAEHTNNVKPFNYSIPESWGELPTYEMAALGYRAEADERYFEIALFYGDKATAQAAGIEIINRMNSYMLNTWNDQNPEMIAAFTDKFQPLEPEVKIYDPGAVLKISCRIISEGVQDVTTLMGSMSFRDLLFLAPEPEEYIGKNGPAVVIIPE